MKLFGSLFDKPSKTNNSERKSKFKQSADSFDLENEHYEQPRSRQSIQSVEQENPLSVESNIDCATSPCGLRPHELLMLEEARRIKVADRKFLKRWERKYDCDPSKLLDSLIMREYVTDSGKAKYFVPPLEKTDFHWMQAVAYADKRPAYGLSIWDICKLMAQQPNIPFRDLYWEQFNEQAMEEVADSGHFNVVQHRIRLSLMSSFLQEEGKYADALCFAAQEMYVQMNEYDFHREVIDLSNQRQALFVAAYAEIATSSTPAYSSGITVGKPRGIGEIKKLIEEGNLEKHEIAAAINKGIERESALLHPLLYDLGEIVSIIDNSLSGKEDANIPLYKTAYERFYGYEIGRL